MTFGQHPVPRRSDQSGADTHGLAAVINHSETSEEWHVAPT